MKRKKESNKNLAYLAFIWYTTKQQKRGEKPVFTIITPFFPFFSFNMHTSIHFCSLSPLMETIFSLENPTKRTTRVQAITLYILTEFKINK